MQYYSATDARAAFSDVLNAAQKQPIVIQRQDKDVAVIISPQEYEKLRQLHVEELMDVCRRAGEYAKSQGLTEEILAELLADES